MKPFFVLMVATAMSLAMVTGVSAAGRKIPHVSKDAHVTAQFFGDSVSLTLGIALATPNLEAKYHYTIRDGGILGCGVAEGPLVIVLGKEEVTAAPCRGGTPANDTPLADRPWPVQLKALLLAHHPNVGVLLAGRWEVVDREYRGQMTDILHPAYDTYIKQQLELASNVVTSSGANMVFITAPCYDSGLQPSGDPWPEDATARVNVYNRLVQEVAAEFPKTDSVVNLNSAVCPDGKFSTNYKGVTIRQPDGVHFTEGAGSVLVDLVMPKILAAGRSQLVRVAKLDAKGTH